MKDDIQHWLRYVDDTFAFIKPESILKVQNVLNSYDQNIKFTYEKEREMKISFLDVSIERTKENLIETSVYRKPTDNNIHMNWHSYSPISWKLGTLRSLIQRALLLSSTETLLQKELNHLRNTFQNNNQFPPRIINSTISKEIRKHQQDKIKPTKSQTDITTTVTSNNIKEEKTKIHLSLPYAGNNGQKMIRKLKRTVENNSRNNINLQVTYKPSKLSSRFKVKDKIRFEHQHNVSYHVKCPNKNCNSNYVGQTKCRIMKRTLQHKEKDNASHILQHSKTTKHRRVNISDVKIIGKGYSSNFKRRISESLFIKEIAPDLNKQKDAFTLKLFN